MNGLLTANSDPAGNASATPSSTALADSNDNSKRSANAATLEPTEQAEQAGLNSGQPELGYRRRTVRRKRVAAQTSTSTRGVSHVSLQSRASDCLRWSSDSGADTLRRFGVIVSDALGVVEGVVGANHQAVCSLGAVPRGDPDRATVRPRHPRTKASANIGSVGFAAGRHHEREFVASDPSQQIVWAQHPGPLVGDFDQQQVSRRMPVPVVDGLEVVDIDQSNGNGLTGAPESGQGTGQLRQEALTSTVAERRFVISVRYQLMRRTGGRGEAS